MSRMSDNIKAVAEAEQTDDNLLLQGAFLHAVIELAELFESMAENLQSIDKELQEIRAELRNGLD